MYKIYTIFSALLIMFFTQNLYAQHSELNIEQLYDIYTEKIKIVKTDTPNKILNVNSFNYDKFEHGKIIDEQMSYFSLRFFDEQLYCMEYIDSTDTKKSYLLEMYYSDNYILYTAVFPLDNTFTIYYSEDIGFFIYDMHLKKNFFIELHESVNPKNPLKTDYSNIKHVMMLDKNLRVERKIGFLDANMIHDIKVQHKKGKVKEKIRILNEKDYTNIRDLSLKDIIDIPIKNNRHYKEILNLTANIPNPELFLWWYPYYNYKEEFYDPFFLIEE
ncbi:hypothetical protein [Chondrinema litorale]|uniref:hypothetical protein n=1 Tax=Chondrinema litorale TaxID=2994555 RepID=UPI002542BA38|nr:hypothetical protein [Chondrinema litorale]UZR97198.1 hypothetical protein OQ292_25195 [Chondrinema litorale]